MKLTLFLSLLSGKRYLSQGILKVTVLLLFPSLLSAQTAFFYGETVPVDELAVYSRIVVIPKSINTPAEEKLFSFSAMPVAYLSVGEVANGSSDRASIHQEWVLGRDKDWNSQVMDVSHPGWQRWLLDYKIPALKQQGFRGLFLDTLDSYFKVASKPNKTLIQQQALGDLILKIQKLHPELYLIANRGFEVMDKIGPVIDEVVAESLLSAYKVADNSYYSTNQSDRQWLINQLNQIKNTHGLTVTVLDYLPESQFDRSSKLIEKINGLGFDAWVTNGLLTALGRGTFKPVPRKILGLYYSQDQDPYNSLLHQRLASSIEYQGYYFEYINLAFNPLPAGPLNNRYAGITLWLSESQLPINSTLCQFVTRAFNNAQIKTAFLGSFPDDPFCAKHFDVQLSNLKLPAPINQIKAKVTAHEVPMRQSIGQYPALEFSVGDAWLAFQSQDKTDLASVLMHPYGGIALEPFVLMQQFDGELYWFIDPLQFIKQSLSLPTIPAPDPTTLNGQQVATVHIDGDGFVSKNPDRNNQFAARAIFEEFITNYPLPTSASIIEAEVSPDGIYPEQASQAISLAREIFQQPHVEIASHSFSHPFVWKTGETTDSDDLRYGQFLAVPGYDKLDLQREIVGSVNFINQQLSPKNKSVTAFFWTGEAVVPSSAIDLTNQLGIWNINGANQKVFTHNFSMSRVWPFGLPREHGYQIYAPVMNENVFTNLWQGPYFGYRNVIDTFKALSQPKRLKPLSIYYHFYSGEKNAGIHALHEVYKYVLSQPINPQFISHYAAMANGFYTTSLATDQAGRWRVAESGQLRTLRWDSNRGWPDLSLSNHVIGSQTNGTQRYWHLSGPSAVLVTKQTSPDEPHLISFNGTIKQWQWQPPELEVSLQTHMQGEMLINTGTVNCRPYDKTAKVRYNKTMLSVTIAATQERRVRFICE